MLKVLLENLIPLLVTVATPVLLVLVHGLMKKLTSKLHLEGLMAYESKVDDLVYKAVAAVEQKALAAAKSGTKTPSEQKLADALAFVQAGLAAANLPAKASDELKHLVEATLFGMR